MKRLFVLRAQDEVWRNLLREMGERITAGKAVAVEVDDYKTNRSKAQFQFALPHGERQGIGIGGCLVCAF